MSDVSLQFPNLIRRLSASASGQGAVHTEVDDPDLLQRSNGERHGAKDILALTTDELKACAGLLDLGK